MGDQMIKAQTLKSVFVFTLTVSLQFAALPAHSATGEDKRDTIEYWQKTPLTTRDLARDGMITQKDCTNNSVGPRACVSSLQALAANGDPVRYLWPKSLYHEYASDYESVGIKIVIDKDLNEYVLARALNKNDIAEQKMKSMDLSNNTKLTLFEQVKRDKDKRDKLYSTIDNLNSSVNYDLLRDEVVKSVATKEKEAWLAKIAIEKYLSFYDGHVSLTTSKELDDNLASAGDESFSGVGLALKTYEDKIIVESVIEGGPAEKNGILQADDVIVQIAQEDGSKTEIQGMGTDGVVKLIRGPSQSKVTITVERNGKRIDAEIVRQKIEMKNVTVKIMNYMNMNFGYIKLSSFMNSNGCQQIKDGIQELQAKNNLRGFILDLRSNGGGLLTQAVCIGGLFVGHELITSQQMLQNKYIVPMISEESKITDLPLVILQNAGSASASELLAGALRDHERAWIVGETSFGKGTVQQKGTFIPKQNSAQDDVLIFQTIARFLQPKGSTNQIVGIQAQFEVPIKPNATDEERFRLREADLFPNAIPPLREKVWQETRSAKIADIQACMQQKGQAQTQYIRLKAEHKTVDYQLFSAMDVLFCNR